MKYKITVENITDPKDRFEMTGDSVIAFVGKLIEDKKEIEHGMGFAGSKQVMAEVISTIPYQIRQMVEEDIAFAKKGAPMPAPDDKPNHIKSESGIILPPGHEDKSNKPKN